MKWISVLLCLCLVGCEFKKLSPEATAYLNTRLQPKNIIEENIKASTLAGYGTGYDQGFKDALKNFGEPYKEAYRIPRKKAIEDYSQWLNDLFNKEEK